MTLAAFTDLSGCAVALQPDAGITLSGSNLTVWADQSGSGRDASVATVIADGYAAATGPIYAAADVDFNSKPSITWGTPNTSAMAIANYTAVPAPCTFIVAGRDQSALGTTGRILFDKLAANGAALQPRWFRAGGNLGAPTDVNGLMWNTTSPPTLSPRRIVGANMRERFVQGVLFRSSTSGMVVHNGVVRADRAMPALPTVPSFSGLRLGRDSSNAIDNQEWTGQLSLFVLYSRELKVDELRDALALAGSICGISWAPGRTLAASRAVVASRTAVASRSALSAPGAVGGRSRVL